MILDETCQQPHVGYALGRKIGSAVRRNRLRRQLRELVKSHQSDLRPGWYVMGASPKATALSFSELSKEMDLLVRKCAKAGAK
jgi:ribonuclease P protein component